MKEQREIGPDGFLASADDPLRPEQEILNEYIALSLPDAPFQVDLKDYDIAQSILASPSEAQVRFVQAICTRLHWLRSNWIKDVTGPRNAFVVEVETGHFGQVLMPLLRTLLRRRLPFADSDIVLLGAIATNRSRCYSREYVSFATFIGIVERTVPYPSSVAQLAIQLTTLHDLLQRREWDSSLSKTALRKILGRIEALLSK